MSISAAIVNLIVDMFHSFILMFQMNWFHLKILMSVVLHVFSWKNQTYFALNNYNIFLDLFRCIIPFSLRCKQFTETFWQSNGVDVDFNVGWVFTNIVRFKDKHFDVCLLYKSQRISSTECFIRKYVTPKINLTFFGGFWTSGMTLFF